jgi:hypothetical protein
MEIAIEKFAIISFLVIGLSHMLAPRAWVEFFIAIRQQGQAGYLINAFIHFPVGALIVSMHNVWHGIPMVLTILGWGWVIKGFLYFCFPKYMIRGLSLVSPERANRFVIAGAVLVSLAGLIGYPMITK